MAKKSKLATYTILHFEVSGAIENDVAYMYGDNHTARMKLRLWVKTERGTISFESYSSASEFNDRETALSREALAFAFMCFLMDVKEVAYNDNYSWWRMYHNFSNNKTTKLRHKIIQAQREKMEFLGINQTSQIDALVSELYELT